MVLNGRHNRSVMRFNGQGLMHVDILPKAFFFFRITDGNWKCLRIVNLEKCDILIIYIYFLIIWDFYTPKVAILILKSVIDQRIFFFSAPSTWTFGILRRRHAAKGFREIQFSNIDKILYNSTVVAVMAIYQL